MADDLDPDCLSQLPDELLQHILYLAPSREAQSTAVLSRRWRGLWPPPTSTVKIDIPSGDNLEEALAAAHGPVERLTIHVGAGESCDLDANDIAGDVLSHPACRRDVQDFRIGAETPCQLFTAAGGSGSDDDSSPSWMPDVAVGTFAFSFGAVVPAAALRVLHITNCCGLAPPPPDSTFPFLEALRLRRCKVSLESLQDMVAASPRLDALQLEYVFLSTVASSPRPTDEEYNRSYDWWFEQSLCCPGVTTLVLVNCYCDCEHEDVAIELDVPRVQYFKYRGKISQFTLRSPPPDLRRAYLHILACHISDDEKCESFWNFLKDFRDAKVLKLKLEWPIDYVAALERKEIWEVLLGEPIPIVFCIEDLENQNAIPIMFSVEHLEIDAPHNPGGKGVGVAIGNLLQFCPALQDLRIKLNTPRRISSRRNSSTSPQGKIQLEFQKSIDHFRRRRHDPPVPLCIDDGKFEVSDISGLSDRWFHFYCLEFHLKRLSLRFHMDKDNPSNCVGVRLMKFFVERAMALEEMYIDEGNMKLLEHMNCKISIYEGIPQPFPENNQWGASRSFTIFPLKLEE